MHLHAWVNQDLSVHVYFLIMYVNLNPKSVWVLKRLGRRQKVRTCKEDRCWQIQSHVMQTVSSYPFKWPLICVLVCFSFCHEETLRQETGGDGHMLLFNAVLLKSLLLLQIVVSFEPFLIVNTTLLKCTIHADFCTVLKSSMSSDPVAPSCYFFIFTTNLFILLFFTFFFLYPPSCLAL